MPKSGYLVLLMTVAGSWQLVAAQPAVTPVTAASSTTTSTSTSTSTFTTTPATQAVSPAPTLAVVPARRQHAPIAVAVVVDQLASWLLRERIDRLPSDGGFARLRREGKYFPEMAFAHAVTETAPGHASLFTGKIPRDHGIVANELLAADGKPHSIVAGDGEPGQLLGLDGKPVSGEGSSFDLLDAKSSLVAAVFRSRYPKGQGLIAALSLKDRGALFAAGEDADLALWFDPKLGDEAVGRKERGGFVTSRRYAAALAKSGLLAFLATYLASDASDRRDGIARLEDQAWKGLDPAWLTENTGIPGDSDYSGFVLAHTASQAGKPGAAFRALPESDRLLLEMALRILKTESRDLPVFISVSLSANDYVGHLFGPDSWEAWDALRRLDTTLAWFWKELDQFGPQSWSVVLSADHGVAPLEDARNRPTCGPTPKTALDSGKPCSGARERGARIHSEDVHSEAESAAGKAGLRGAGGAHVDKVIAGVVYPYIYLTEAARTALASEPSARNRLTSRLDSELRRKFKSLHAVMDVRPFKEGAVCPDERKDRLTTLVCNSISPAPDRGGDYYLVLKPGAFFDPDLVKGTGAGHGSPYGYDRFVPLFVRDPSRPELAGQVEAQRTLFTQFRDELVRIILSAPLL